MQNVFSNVDSQFEENIKAGRHFLFAKCRRLVTARIMSWTTDEKKGAYYSDESFSCSGESISQTANQRRINQNRNLMATRRASYCPKSGELIMRNTEIRSFNTDRRCAGRIVDRCKKEERSTARSLFPSAGGAVIRYHQRGYERQLKLLNCCVT